MGLPCSSEPDANATAATDANRDDDRHASWRWPCTVMFLRARTPGSAAAPRLRPSNASTVGLDLVIGARQRTTPTLVRRHRIEGRNRRLSQRQSQFCLRGEPLQRLLGLLSPLRV